MMLKLKFMKNLHVIQMLIIQKFAKYDTDAFVQKKCCHSNRH